MRTGLNATTPSRRMCTVGLITVRCPAEKLAKDPVSCGNITFTSSGQPLPP